MEEKMFLNQFADPSGDFRGKPFWAWNGKLEKEELIRQIRVIKQMGFGGFFMHSRAGLSTEYMGAEWMDCIRACSKEASKLGMQAYLYDEDRWPSGSAGGVVTKNPKYRLKYIRAQTFDKNAFDLIRYGQEYLASFAVRLDDKRELLDYYPVTDVINVKDGYRVTVFAFEEEEQNEFYNGYTYVDTMNAEAVGAYIKETHERYAAACGDMFGKEIRGIFTDEPHRGYIFGGFAFNDEIYRNRIPYTYTLFETFKKKNGYDLLRKLPEVYYRGAGEGFSKTAYDFVEVLQRLFLDNFAKPYRDFCQKNKLIATGHVLHEDTLSDQVATSGSVQRYYEYMDYPGVDVLCEDNKQFWVVKQAYSVAKQLNKPFVLSELYGVSGWQMNFESHKHVGDWQAVLGINLRCHHLSWYTMQGEAKRDFPASIFYQSGWHDKYKYVEDYFSRMGYILSQGKPVTDILVINPIESVWGLIRKGCFDDNRPSAEIKAVEDGYTALFKELADNGLDFDYADEDILKRRSKIKNRALYVGAMKYTTVVLSGMRTVRQSTLDILNRFAAAGGKVIVKDIPDYIDGLKAEADISAFERAGDYESVAEECRKLTAVKQNRLPGVLTHIRKTGRGYYAVMVNTDREKEIDAAEVRFNLPCNAEELDLRSGEIKGCRFERFETGIKIYTSFTKGGERAFRLTKGEVKPYKEKNKSIREITLDGSLEYELTEDNVLVLDIANCLVDGEDIGADEILKIDRTVRRMFQLPFRRGDAIQPWYKEKYFGVAHKEKICRLDLLYEFNIETMPEGDLFFAAETPRKFDICVNGGALKQEPCGTFIDNSIIRLKLPREMLAAGKNAVTLSCDFSESTDLEACYITGSFGVALNGPQKTVTALPQKLDSRPLFRQGLPFYGGKIKFFTGIGGGACAVAFDRIRGACVEADFGGGDAEIVAFAPYETKVHDATGEITFTLNLTRRNTFGPLHQTPPFNPAGWPALFLTEGQYFSLDYGLIDEGLDIPKIRFYE
ncbi:MAG: hypothetical protein LBL66_04735 [Clostridiales bacterium]|jgi:hypothetical protein|nr:hypothetical protein [Clostridiales bacterium]